MNWTILVDKNSRNIYEPIYGRTIYASEINDINDIKYILPKNIQTIGISIPQDRRDSFIYDAANLGGLRFPQIGQMSLYENPWDGIFPMNEH